MPFTKCNGIEIQANPCKTQYVAFANFPIPYKIKSIVTFHAALSMSDQVSLAHISIHSDSGLRERKSSREAVFAQESTLPALPSSIRTMTVPARPLFAPMLSSSQKLVTYHADCQNIRLSFVRPARFSLTQVSSRSPSCCAFEQFNQNEDDMERFFPIEKKTAEL